MTIYNSILQSISEENRLLAVLIDPEKMPLTNVSKFVRNIHQSVATHIFVGGSTDKENQMESLIHEIKKYTTLPVILFPGSSKQVAKNADGILFLSLLSGRNPEYLIEHQVNSALEIHNSDLEVIPTGYILIDGGKETSVQRVTNTYPIPANNYQEIVKTALAGQYTGKKIIYLEAGSGALKPVSSEAIQYVKNELQIPIIVGGGIRSKHQIENAYNAGADIVVIGTAFEEDISFFNQLKKEPINENIR